MVERLFWVGLIGLSAALAGCFSAPSESVPSNWTSNATEILYAGGNQTLVVWTRNAWSFFDEIGFKGEKRFTHEISFFDGWNYSGKDLTALNSFFYCDGFEIGTGGLSVRPSSELAACGSLEGYGGCFNPLENKIWIKNGMPELFVRDTLLHEVAHYLNWNGKSYDLDLHAAGDYAGKGFAEWYYARCFN